MAKKIIGFALISISLIAMGFWEFWGRETLAYDTILVLKNPLPAHTIVTEADFSFKKVESPSKYALKESHMDELLTMETSQYVADDTELRMEYFCKSKFAAGEEKGRGTMALPVDWLLSSPQTLMRGDNIIIYNKAVKIGELIVTHTRDSSNNEILFQGRDRQNASGVVNYIEVIGETSTLVEISKLASEGTRFTFICL